MSVSRESEIINILNMNDKPISASKISEKLNVSRQIIVGDIALLRAKGINILSTPRGYIIDRIPKNDFFTFEVECLHDKSLAQKEIYTIIDNGGTLIDVIVNHPLYGKICCALNISSRFEADQFLKKSINKNISLLSNLTDGVHLHSISCKDEETSARIKFFLKENKLLF